MPKPSQIYTTYETRYSYLLDEGYSEDEAEDLANDEEAFDLEIMEYDDSYTPHSSYSFVYEKEINNNFINKVEQTLKEIDDLLNPNETSNENFEKRLNYYLNKGYKSKEASKLARLKPNFEEDLKAIIEKIQQIVTETSKQKNLNDLQRIKIINELTEKINKLTEISNLLENNPKKKLNDFWGTVGMSFMSFMVIVFIAFINDRNHNLSITDWILVILFVIVISFFFGFFVIISDYKKK